MSSEMDNMILSPVPMDKLLQSIRQVVKEEIQASLLSKKSKGEGFTHYLSGKEVAARFKITSPTLRAWRRDGLVKAYRIRRKLYYKPAEIHSALKEVIVTI